MPRLHEHAIDQALHVLASLTTQISCGERLRVVGLGVVGRFKQQRAGDVAALRRDALPAPDYDHGQGFTLTVNPASKRTASAARVLS